jgi:glycosyltransferase involved in cell wall biosynthesis
MVIQLLPTISYGDAVSSHALALERLLKKNKYKTGIYAESIDVRFPNGTAKRVNKLPKLSKDDVVIYHMSTGSYLNEFFGNLPCKKVMIYHNVTPAEFLEPYNSLAAKQCREGLASVKALADKVDYCITVSEFNKKDLVDMGYKCRIDVLPILIPFSDYDKQPDHELIEKYDGDGYTNILFTGRLAPNKCQEDVIKAYALYKKYYNPKSRLILVGSSSGYENYRRRLEIYISTLQVENVIMTGHIKFSQILSYYNLADIFLCMSEHEGFCVPLVEAMYFNVPVIAYDSSAIGGTLGGSGILLKEKDALLTAGMIDRLVRDSALRKKVIFGQQERLADFSPELIEEKFMQLLRENVL